MQSSGSWEVEFTDEFEAWWNSLSEGQQEDVRASVKLLMEFGPSLGFPHTSGIEGAKLRHLRELRTQSGGRPLRTLYAFDPRRTAILLIGGDKTGNPRWYEENVPRAEEIYAAYLEQLRKEGLI